MNIQNIQIKPISWTHHHFSRLFHSVVFCVSLLVMLLIGFGIFIEAQNSNADTVTVNTDVGTSARIPFGDDEPSTEIITPTPEPPSGGAAYWVYPDRTPSPTPIYYPPTSPTTTEPGQTPPKPTTPPKKPIIIPKPEDEGPLIPVPIPKSFIVLSLQIENKEILPGERLHTLISIQNLGATNENIKFPIRFEIINEQGEKVFVSEEYVYIQNEVILKKDIQTYTNIEPGLYQFRVIIPTTDGNIESSEYFQVKGSPILHLSTRSKINKTVVFQGLFLLLFFFFLISYFEYNKISIISGAINRIHDEDIKKPI